MADVGAQRAIYSKFNAWLVPVKMSRDDKFEGNRVRPVCCFCSTNLFETSLNFSSGVSQLKWSSNRGVTTLIDQP